MLSFLNKALVIIEEEAGPFCLALLMMVLGLQVGGRALGFGSKLTWTDEASRILFVWSIFLSLPLASKKGAMVYIKLSEKLWPALLRPFVERLAVILWGLSSLGVAVLSLMNIYAHREFPQLTPILNLNQNHLFLVIPLAFGLVFVRTLLGCFSATRKL